MYVREGKGREMLVDSLLERKEKRGGKIKELSVWDWSDVVRGWQNRKVQVWDKSKQKSV